MSILQDLILEQYQDNLPVYKKMKEVVINILEATTKELGVKIGFIEGRVKNKSSLAKKIELKGTKYKSINDITDIVGVRLITLFQSEVDKIASQIVSKFKVDWTNSIDKRKIYQIDQFGYMSLHYIVSIPKELYYDENMPLLNELRCEIQIRTNLQHTWASIFHDTGYKNDVEVPKEVLRRFSRLAGLLEMADEEFQSIHDFLIDYRRKVISVVKSGNFEEVELTGDSYQAFVQAGAFDKLNKKIASINNMEIEHAPLDNFLPIFKEFGFVTLKQLDDFVKENSDAAYQLELLQFADTDIDIITTIAGPFALAVTYIVKKGFGVAYIKYLVDQIFGEKKSNQHFAEKLYKQCLTIGLIKDGDDDA